MFAFAVHVKLYWFFLCLFVLFVRCPVWAQLSPFADQCINLPSPSCQFWMLSVHGESDSDLVAFLLLMVLPSNSNRHVHKLKNTGSMLPNLKHSYRSMDYNMVNEWNFGKDYCTSQFVIFNLMSYCLFCCVHGTILMSASAFTMSVCFYWYFRLCTCWVLCHLYWLVTQNHYFFPHAFTELYTAWNKHSVLFGMEIGMYSLQIKVNKGVFVLTAN